MKNAGRIMPLPKGEYNSAVTYNLLDFVTHDGSSYICKKESTGNTPSENSEYWQLMARKGSSGGAVTSVNGMDGDVTLTAEDVGALSNEDNVFLGKRGIISGEDLDNFVSRKSGGYAVQRTDHTDMLTVFAISAHSTSTLEFLHKYDMSFLRVRSAIDNNRYSLWKEIAFTTSNVASATKATQDKNGNDIVNTYATKVEMNAVKKSVSDGKTLVANAITAKGVTTAADAEFATMATNIGKIQTGVNTSDATAVAANILSGKTAYIKGSKVTGTMAEKAGVTVDATATTQDSNYTYLSMPEGHYSATSKVRTPNSNIDSKKFIIRDGQILNGQSFIAQDCASITYDSTKKVQHVVAKSSGIAKPQILINIPANAKRLCNTGWYSNYYSSTPFGMKLSTSKITSAGNITTASNCADVSSLSGSYYVAFMSSYGSEEDSNTSNKYIKDLWIEF